MIGYELEVATRAVEQGMELVRRIQQNFSPQDCHIKNDLSPVTLADFSVQALISHQLTVAFPHLPLVAEEDATFLLQEANGSLGNRIAEHLRPFIPETNPHLIAKWIERGGSEPRGRFWAMDPIDGTKGFLRHDQFAIALALIDSNEVVLGVLGCPRLKIVREKQSDHGFLFVAQKGKGSYVKAFGDKRFQKIRVSSQTDKTKCRLVESYESSHSDFRAREYVQKNFSQNGNISQLDGQVKYGIVASGDAEIYLRVPYISSKPYYEKIWDHAAGALIVEEAGGKVTDIDGKSLNFSLGRTLQANRGILATHGSFHSQVIEALHSYFQQISPVC